MDELILHLESIINDAIINTKPLSGGDTSSVLKLESRTNSYVLKYGTGNKTADMFKAEAKGLQLISETNTIATPKLFTYETEDSVSYLLTEFIESKQPSSSDFETLGLQLSELHKHNSEKFGLDGDNFIGSLPQINTFASNWIDFYSQYRLDNQFQLALKKGLLNPSEIPSLHGMKSTMQSICPAVKPSLVHGDLWSGNYLISKDGKPYLIDPAVYYGHGEVDIAMSKLFGGFHQSFYEAYHKNLFITPYYEERLDLYQLYFLLVHLNLFGSSYYGSVKRILKSLF